MTERPSNDLQLACLVAGNPGEGDGTVGRPFATLAETFAHLAQTARTSTAQVSGRRHLEVVCLARVGELGPQEDRPCYQFFVDPTAADGGEGSEDRPWPSVESAAKVLHERCQTGQLRLRVGERLCLVEREAFAPTELETRRHRKETVAHYVFLAMALVCVVPVVATLGYLLLKGGPTVTWEFLTTNPDNNFTEGGIWAPLIGTFFLVLASLVIAAPVGVLAGVYLNEYAGESWATRIINLAVANLAGVPSIVHALFGVGAFVLFAHMGKSLLAAATTVAVMTLPVIITSTREALAAVPMSFREACWNMGATRWQTIRTIVLPNSVAGILTGVILEVARAAGETAPILFTGVVLYVPIADTGWESLVPYGPNDRFMALSYHLFTLCTQIRGVRDEVLYGTAVVLIGLVLAVNSVSIVLRIRFRSRKRW